MNTQCISQCLEHGDHAIVEWMNAASYFLHFYLFIYFWLRWVFVAAHGLSPVVVNGGFSLLQRLDFSLWWLLLLQSMDSTGLSSCGSWGLEHGVSSCGSWALLLWGMWDFPGPGIKLVSSALAGRLPTTGPPGKSLLLSTKHLHWQPTYHFLKQLTLSLNNSVQEYQN